MLEDGRLHRVVWTKREVVPGEGLQPSRAFARMILNHVRIAISPPRQLIAPHYYRRAEQFSKGLEAYRRRFKSWDGSFT